MKGLLQLSFELRRSFCINQYYWSSHVSMCFNGTAKIKLLPGSATSDLTTFSLMVLTAYNLSREEIQYTVTSML